MSKEFVRAVLVEEAESNVPTYPDLWAKLSTKVETDNRSQSNTGRLRTAFKPGPLLPVGGLALLVIALWSVSLWTQPAPVVSADEIVARAAQVVAEEPGADIRSFHGVYTSRYRHDPNGSFSEGRAETWFEAPGKYAQVSSNSYSNGQDETWTYGTDNGFTYSYAFGREYVQMSDIAFTQVQDSTTTTVRVRPFSPTSLQSVLEIARRKLPPALNEKSDPRPPYMYEARLSGEEQVLGRTAYVIEMTLVPGASLQLPDSQVPEKMKIWVDKALYATLRIEGWNADGVVLQSGAYESFEVNSNIQFDVLKTLAPPGTDIVDTRPVPDAATIEEGWQVAAQSAPRTVFRPSSVPERLEPGRPFYNTRREVVTQQYQGKALAKVLGVVDASGQSTQERPATGPEMREVVAPRLIITQGAPASINADGLGEGVAVQVGTLTARFYSQGGAHTLMFDRDGTRIKLYAPSVMGAASRYTSEELAKIAGTLQPVEKK